MSQQQSVQTDEKGQKMALEMKQGQEKLERTEDELSETKDELEKA